MKLAVVLLSLSLLSKPPATLIVIDTDLKKPVTHSDNFTVEQYFKKSFPIYSADVDAVIKATEKAAKLIEQETGCYTTDTIKANQTTLFIHTNCEKNKIISVRLTTRLEASGTTFGFEVVKNEDNKRGAQRKLLDFVNYLANESE